LLGVNQVEFVRLVLCAARASGCFTASASRVTPLLAHIAARVTPLLTSFAPPLTPFHSGRLGLSI
jgi:hypothetical protein